MRMLWKVISKPKESYFKLMREFNCKKYRKCFGVNK